MKFLSSKMIALDDTICSSRSDGEQEASSSDEDLHALYLHIKTILSMILKMVLKSILHEQINEKKAFEIEPKMVLEIQKVFLNAFFDPFPYCETINGPKLNLRPQWDLPNQMA